MYTKWWKQKGALVCDLGDEKKKDSAAELGIENVIGVFVVLFVGLFFSFIVAVFELIWHTRQTKDDNVI